MKAEISQSILGPSYGLDNHRIRVQFLAQGDIFLSSNVQDYFKAQTPILLASWALSSGVKQPRQAALHLFSCTSSWYDA